VLKTEAHVLSANDQDVNQGFAAPDDKLHWIDFDIEADGAERKPCTTIRLSGRVEHPSGMSPDRRV
jgi:hypothetical protein